MGIRPAISTLCLLFTIVTILAQPVQSATKPTPIASVPTEKVNNRIVVHVPVGRYRLHLVLDTGATSTALFQSDDYLFDDIARTGDASILFPALDEQVEGHTLEPVTLQFGDYQYTAKEMLLVRKRPPVGDRLNFKFDGVLGQDFFDQHTVELDVKTHQLRLYPKGTNLRRHFARRIKLHMKGLAPHIKFESQLPWERRETTKEMLLDTGFPGLMVIWNERHFELAAGKKNAEIYRKENRGVITRATFKMGSLKFFDAPLFLGANVPKQVQKRDGLIGANILNQFNHAIDFTNKQLLLGSTRSKYDFVDGTFYLPNNEEYVYKRYFEKGTGSKFVIGNNR